MKKYYSLLIAVLYGLNPNILELQAQCDPSFTYETLSNTFYHFTANQTVISTNTYYHSWSVDGQVQSHNQTCDYDFYSAGTYQVCHIISIQNSGGSTLCTDSDCRVVQINPTPQCLPNFSVLHHQTGPLATSFFSTIADYTNIAVQWNFGDGNIVYGDPAPVHSYSAFGYYYACIYATDTVQHCADTVCVSVRLDSCQIYPYFTWYQQSFLNTSVEFRNISNGIFQHVNLDFGDGNSSSQVNITHVYPSPGIYNACLTLTDSISGCAGIFCDSVRIETCSAGLVGFDYTPDYGDPLHVSFNGTYPNNYHLPHPNFILWDFGDGILDTSYFFANHQYSLLGDYLACFHVNYPGCGTLSSCDSVHLTCDVDAQFSSRQIASNTMQYDLYSNSGNLNLKYEWRFGDGALGSESHPIHVYAASGTYNACLILTDSLLGCSDTICQLISPQLWNDTICGFVFVDLNLNGIHDSLEPPVVAFPLIWGSFSEYQIINTDSNGHYSTAVPQQTDLWIFAGGGSAQLTLPMPNNNTPFYGNYTYNFPTGNQRQCGFDFGFAINTGTLRGFVFGDLNYNGVQESGEFGIPNQLVDAGGQKAMTMSDGQYRMVVPVGSYNVTKDPSGLYAGFGVIPSQIPVTISTPGSLRDSLDFGITVAGLSDMAVDLIPVSPLYGGGISKYKLLTTNLGADYSECISGMVTDSMLTYTSSNPIPDIQSNDSVAWYNFLDPFGQNLQSVNCRVSTSAGINYNAYNQSFLNPAGSSIDADVSNNIDVCHQVVVAALDPNNKIANEAGIGPQGYINTEQKIKYVINFQNTGTSYAINVVVKDILDVGFDLSTFRFIGSSHLCDALIVGDTLYFRFSRIMLIDSFTNEEESHGWVAFEIKPEQNLAPGTPLHNAANIYFDHNDPVATNTTLHTIENPLGLSEPGNNCYLEVIPNPFTEKTVVRLINAPEGDYQFTISALTGNRAVQGKLSSENSIALYSNQLTAGTYILEVRNFKGLMARTKLVLLK